MNKIRILYIITALNIGGAEMMLYRMLGALDKNVYEIAVISLLDKGEVGMKIEADYNIPVISLQINKGLNRLKFVCLLGREIKKWKPDLVHSHMYHANLISRLTRIFYRIPVLINTIHNIDESGDYFRSKLRLFSYRITNSLCDLVTQVSRSGLEKYLTNKAVTAEKGKYIPNGIAFDSTSFNENIINQKRNELEIAEQFVFLAVGSLTKQKDYPNLLRSFARVSEIKPGSLLLVAGGGLLELELKAYKNALNMGNNVRFLGMRNDIPILMKLANAFVMSSAWEGMPIVLLEAAAAKLPIIATDVGGNSELVMDGISGFLVSAQNSEALSSAMLEMIELNSDQRINFGISGYNYVKSNYSLEVMIAKWEKIYRDKYEAIQKI